MSFTNKYIKRQIYCLVLFFCVINTNAFALTKSQQENIKTCEDLTFDGIREYNSFPTTTKRMPVMDTTKIMRAAFTKQLMKKRNLSFSDSIALCQQMYNHIISLHEIGYSLEKIKQELLKWE